jgi:hypothetical protein
MDKPRPSITPLPASALFHFAFPLREYAAIKAAVAFFAEKLRDPREKETAQRALAMLESPTGLSLPSVEGEKEVMPSEPRTDAGGETRTPETRGQESPAAVTPIAPAPAQRATRSKGLAGLGGKK